CREARPPGRRGRRARQRRPRVRGVQTRGRAHVRAPRAGARPGRRARRLTAAAREDRLQGGVPVEISASVNGVTRTAAVEPGLLLVPWLREPLRLTGTHVGCDTSGCGACTVLLDGVPVKSCTVLAVQADGREITTVEGLGGRNGTALHPIQEAFKSEHGLQCGFCTPG